jgi:hypothetical protein
VSGLCRQPPSRKTFRAWRSRQNAAFKLSADVSESASSATFGKIRFRGNVGVRRSGSIGQTAQGEGNGEFKFPCPFQQSLRAEGIEYHVVSFNGKGAKDVTEYMENHRVEDLMRLIGIDIVQMPDGSYPQDPHSGMTVGPRGRILLDTGEINL